MPTYYVDPTVAGPGAGSFANPYKAPASATLAPGDSLLFKEGSTHAGTYTVPASGASGSPITFGTYRASDGAPLVSGARARIAATTSSGEGIYATGRDYIAIKGLIGEGGAVFPGSGIKVESGSHWLIEDCEGRGNYGARIDIPNGVAVPEDDIVMRRLDVLQDGGNQGIIVVWGSTAGAYFTNITLDGCTVRRKSAASAVMLTAREQTSTYANLPGYTSKGVQVIDCDIADANGYGLLVYGISQGGAQQNRIVGNRLSNLGDGAHDVHCMWLGCGHDVIIESNQIDRSTPFAASSIGTGIGIFIDRPPSSALNGCKRVLVQRNTLRRTGVGDTANTSAEVAGAGIAVLSGEDIWIRRNLIDHCNNGIAVMGGFGADFKSTRIRATHNIILAARLAGMSAVSAADRVAFHRNAILRCATGIYIETTSAAPVTNYSERLNGLIGCGIDYQSGNAITVTPATLATRSSGRPGYSGAGSRFITAGA